METVTAGGAEIPALGFGTYPMKGETCRRAVSAALDVGYRHVDTAQMYDNEDAVGAAIAESAVPIEETMGAMNDLQSEGAVEHVGVSNFSVDQLRAAMDASETPVVTNQVEYHPYRDRSKLLEFCVEHDVALTAYSPLAEGDVVGDETLAAIGEPYGKSAAQVALRWLLQQPNVVAIPKASSREHIAANFDVLDFELTDDEMERVSELGGGLGRRLRDLLGL